jgi:putative protein-disulfide isomerase
VADVILVTDPMCSWCWGMAEEIERARATLAQELEFDLVVGGINVGSQRGVSDFARARLALVWREVALVTGAAFGPGLPGGEFVYDSTPACLAVETVRALTGEPPFEFVRCLQRRFFVDGADVTAWPVLAETVADLGIDVTAFGRLWQTPDIRDRVAAGFLAAKSYGTAAMPSVLLDENGTRRLVVGGYVDAPTLVATLRGLASA